MKQSGLKILRERGPEIARWLAEVPPPEQVQVLRSPKGSTLEIDGIRLESAVDPEAEADLQAVPVASSKTVHLYGWGRGTLVRTLLARPELERLNVVILEPSSVAVVLERTEHEWLADPRVHLVRGDRPAELACPFAVVPSALSLAHPDCARLADLLRLELATPHIQRHLQGQEALWSQRIDGNAELLGTDPDVGDLFGTRDGERILVAAAGPSLAEHFDRLRTRTDVLIAVDAALGPLLEAGVVPDYLVTVDAHEDGMRRVFNVSKEALGDCTLVYVPTVLGEVLRAWPGPRAGAFLSGAYFDRILQQLPSDQVREQLWCSGSVFHSTVDLAVRMGAVEVEFLGADFAHIGGRTHVENAAWSRGSNKNGPRVRSGHGEELPSLPNLIGYLRDLERYIARTDSVRFVNASRSGARIEGAHDREGVSVG